MLLSGAIKYVGPSGGFEQNTIKPLADNPQHHSITKSINREPMLSNIVK